MPHAWSMHGTHFCSTSGTFRFLSHLPHILPIHQPRIELTRRYPVVDLRGAPGMRAPLGVQILSFSCSFRPKKCVSTPTLGVGAPPGENPRSATGILEGCSGSIHTSVLHDNFQFGGGGILG